MIETESAQKAASESAAGPPSTRDRLNAALVAAGFAALALRLWSLVGSLAVSVPYWDQWDFLDGLFRDSGWVELFVWQHGPHRQGFAGIVYGILYPLTDWSARAEAFVAWSAIVAGALVCLLLKRRLEGRLAAADLFVALAFCSLSSFELFLGAQNLAHGPLPVLLVTVAAMLARSIEAPLRLVLLALVAVIATFTGFGLALGPPVALALGIELVRSRADRRRRVALFGALLLVALGWIGFLRDYRWLPLPANDCVDRSLLGKAGFAGAIVGRAWGVLALRETEWVDFRLAVGFALCLLLATTAIRAAVGLARDNDARRERWRTILVLSGFSLLFVLLSTAGRSCLGVESAFASRYTIYSAPGMVGVYLWAVSSSRRARNVLVPLLLLLVVQKELRSGSDARLARESHGVKLAWVDCYRERRDLDRCDRETGMGIHPASGRAHSRIQEKLDYLESHRLSLFSAAEDRRAEERRLARGSATAPSDADRDATSKRRGGKKKRRAGRQP